ncbi:MAG: hypothetical protein M3N68_11985 [Actinomycetota bacterium]|nr:hypothetical protein [Actinomycetota bacterium]
MAEAGRTRATPGSDGADWTVQVADTVERLVGTIRDKTAVPLTTVARGLIYGLIALVMAITAVVLIAIGLVRAVDAYLPEEVWSAHLLVGGMFCLAGAFLLRKATTAQGKR